MTWFYIICFKENLLQDKIRQDQKQNIKLAMSTKQYFTKVLQQVNQSQQGFTVHTSIYLKKIEQYLFSGKGPQNVTGKQAQLLFLGIPQKKYQGFFELAGVKGTFGGLKKSSYYALDIIHSCVSKGKHKEVFQKVFTQCDEQDFKLLRLATHITDAKNQNALQICGILKSKRPYLNQTDYIFSQDSRKIFQKWYASHKKKKNQITGSNQLKSVCEPNPQDQNVNRDVLRSNPLALIEGMMKAANISTDLEELQFYEDYIVDNEEEYFLDTFLDPIDIFQNKKNNDQQRDWLVFKQFMYYLVQTPVTKVSQSAIQQYINKIHIQSQYFSPDVLISKFHKKMTEQQKSALSKVVPLHFGLQYKKNLTKYFFQTLTELSKNVSMVKDNFVQNQTIKTEASVGFSLRTKMKQSMKNLCDKVQPLSQKYHQTQKLRKLIIFLEANSDFVKMPRTIRKMLDERNIKSIVSLYRKFQVLIQAYKNSPVIKDIIEQIENVLIQARIKQIQIAFQNNLGKEELQILLGLFPDKSQALIQYLAPKLIIHLIRQIDEGNRSQEVSTIETKVKKYQLINFRRTLQNCMDTANQLQIRDDDGDCLNEFLNQMNKQKNIIEKCHQLKDRIMVKFKNFFQIKKKWANEYNCYFIQVKILSEVMTLWYGKMIEQIIQQKAFELVYITSQILIIVQKNTQQPSLYKQIQKLKQSNFQAYCTLMTQKTKQQTEFKKSPIKKDTDNNYFNDILVRILDSIINNIPSILKFPSFQYRDSLVLRVYKYLQDCLTVEDNKLINLPQLFTYSTVVTCLAQSKITLPFFRQLQQFKSLKRCLEQVCKKQMVKIQNLLYSIIKIEYRSTINKNKNGSFAFQILQYLNQCCYLIATYGSIKYKRYSEFLIQGFQHIANQASSEIVKENGGKNFIRDLELIRSMTNKIKNRRINSKWDHLLRLVEFNVQQKSQNELFVLQNKHKYSSNFSGLMDY